MLKGEPLTVGLAQLDAQVFDVRDQFNVRGLTAQAWDDQKPLVVLLCKNSGLKFPEVLPFDVEESNCFGHVHNKTGLFQKSKRIPTTCRWSHKSCSQHTSH